MDQKRKKVKKKVCSSNSSPSNWADLPDDVLDLILEKLVSVYNIIKFSFVCKSWSSMALIHKEKLIPLINHQPPWLFVNTVCSSSNVVKPKSLQGHTIRKQRLFNFIDGSKILNFKLRIPFKYKHKECFGSSYGWLFYKDIRNCVMVLVNPISGTVIRLPPIKIRFFNSEDVKKFIWSSDHVILSNDPCLGSFEVLFMNINDMIAHLKFGDEFWTYSQHLCSLGLKSFAFCENCILGVSESGRIFHLYVNHFSNDELSRRIKYCEIPRDLNKVKLRNSSPILSSFVKTTNGDLLMVHEYGDTREKYKIFKIKCYSNVAFHIVPIANLDGHCLFLNNRPYGQCISVLASNYPGCRANSIYHSDRREVVQKYFVICSWKEFNLEDQSVQTKKRTFRICPAGSRIDHVFWMVPSIKL